MYLTDVKYNFCCACLGHNLAEMVSVQAYLCSETIPLTWVGEASLEYVHDDAQVRKAKKNVLVVKITC